MKSVILVALLLLSSCRADGRAGAGKVETSPSPKTVLRLTLTHKPSAPRAGQSISLTLKLTATTGTTLRFSSGQRYDFIALDTSHKAVWQWSQDKAFTQVLGTERLNVGGEATYEETWTPDSPGFYTIKGIITAIEPIETEVKVAVGR